MSNSEMSAAAHDTDVEGVDMAGSAPSQGHELKDLLNAIAAQLSDVDRRHTTTLDEMQSRLAAMGREAETIRTRVPMQFRPAFERIESGLQELAHRIADAGIGAPAQHADPLPYVAAHETPFREKAEPQDHHPEMPMALRSAQPAGSPAPRRSTSNIDNFDVIESSLPGNSTDPWDREAAEALSGLYETGGASFGSKVAADDHGHSQGPALQHAAPSQTSAARAAIDQVWLEARFSDIAKGIEQSLADIRPDHGFYALGQRLDQFEQQFSKKLESIATQADVEGVRVIEAHVGEVIGHLVQTQDQLARLNVIEDQLALISTALADVQAAAAQPLEASRNEPAVPQIDVEAIALAAAEQAAQRFASLIPPDFDNGTSELRPLLERMMSESRQGEESTTALLDTLQQAMIRLLDRVDAIELAQHQTLSQQSAPHEYVREQVRFNIDQPRAAAEDSTALEAAVAAVASAKSISPPRVPEAASEAASAQSRNAEKSRQDFIADARRAKARLAAQAEDDVSIAAVEGAAAFSASLDAEPEINAGAKQEGNWRRGVPGATPIPRVPSGKSSGPSAPSTRLMALAGAAVLALSGIWYSMSGSSATSTAASSMSNVAPASMIGASKPAQAAAPAVDPVEKAAPDAGTKSATGERSDLNGDTTVGEIVPSRVVNGATSLPMLGIAVDAEQPVTADDIQQAHRHQSMAEMSGRIAEAAAKSTGQMATPSTLIPRDDEVSAEKISADPSSLPANMSRTAALDMPPATVGPLSLRLAAANGDPSAEFEVGARLAEGKGTGQNFRDAARWYQRAADHGSAQAQYRLGTLYERGLGVKADASRAAAWYEKSAEQGNIKAMHNLAVLSANQTSPDYTTATRWFEEAAERGLSDSQFNLAVLYENGLGVKQDMKQAFKWLSIASRNGDKESVRRLDILRGKLTAAELKDAQQMTTGWKPQTVDRAVNDARIAGEAWKKNPKNGVSG